MRGFVERVQRNEVCLLARDHAAVHARQRRVHHRDPGKAGDTKAMNLAAVESVLKTYHAILRQKPDAKAKVLDDLLKKQSQGKLQDSLKQCQ